MDKFQSVFSGAEELEEEFDTIIDSEQDGSLVDAVCGFGESGECETDFDELHQTQGDADVDDFEKDLRVDDETDNAPKGAEGTDSDPAIDLALGETADDEFSDTGVKGKTDADDFYNDYNEPEEVSATTGEGPDVNMDNQNIEDEFDKIAEAVTSGNIHESDQSDTDKSDSEDELEGKNPEDKGLTEDMDSFMEGLDCDDECDKDDETVEESTEYEEGDSDLVDMVAGNE